MPFQIVRNDLVDVEVDALVLPSNSRLVIDGGTGLAVGKKAGLWRLRRACKRIGWCDVGSAVATPAFSLPAKHLIHAVGPVWGSGSESANVQLLRRAYDSALSLAAELDCASVALPLLSAGTFGCPSRVSLEIALDAIEAHLLEHDTQVTLVLYSRSAVKAGLAEFEQIESYIDDNYVDSRTAERGFAESVVPGSAPTTAVFLGRERFDACDGEAEEFDGLEALGEPDMLAAAPVPHAQTTGASLESALDSLDAGFTETLLSLIDASGRTDADVYKRANITRQHFSKIRKDLAYRPTKRTAVALAVALELDLPATLDLLSRAGYTLTHASKFDVIVEWFIVNGNYNTYKINEALYAYDQQLLG